MNQTHADKALSIARRAYDKAVSKNDENWASTVDNALLDEGFETSFYNGDDETVVAVALDDSGSGIIVRRSDRGQWTVTEGDFS